MVMLKFGVIGFGGAGRAHVRRLNGLNGVRVTAVYDPKLSTINAKNEKLYRNIIFTDNLERFLSMGIDAVTICSPDHTHFYYAQKTVERGLHTIVEKPMFVSYNECIQMEELLKKKDKVIFGTHHQKRFIPAFATAKQYVDSGKLGDIVMIEVDYIHDMTERATMFDDWRISSENPQKVVLGAMSHSFDLIEWIVGSEIETIFSLASHKGWPQYPDDDAIVTILKYKSGTIAKAASAISSRGLQRERLAIYGTKGQIHNNLLIDSKRRSHYLVEPSEGLRLNQRILSKLLKSTTIWEYPYTINEHNKACVALLSEFVDSIRKCTKFCVRFEEIKKVIQICLASIQSYEEGRPIQIERLF
jgi:predicted dehydrogenase